MPDFLQQSSASSSRRKQQPQESSLEVPEKEPDKVVDDAELLRLARSAVMRGFKV